MKNPARLLLPSLTDIVFAGLLLALLAGAGARLLADGDTGYHVAAGQYMLVERSVPHHDIFSWHTPAPRWIAFEWLSQVAFALAHRWQGLDGVVGLAALLLALTFAVLHHLLRRPGGNVWVVLFVLLLTLATSALHWLARPHLFSLLLAVFWLDLLERQRISGKSPLALLPISMLLWVNLHAGFIVGLALVAIYLAGGAVRHLAAPLAERSRTRPAVRALAATAGACLIAALLNPNGAQALLHPIVSLGATFTMDHITEFRSPDFHALSIWPFALMLLLLVTLLARSDRKPGVEQTLQLLLFGYLALTSQRHIPFFALIAAPILVEQLDALLGRWRGHPLATWLEQRSRTVVENEVAARGHLWCGAAVVVGVLLVASGRLDYQFDPETKPVAAVHFLQGQPLAGRVFNEYEFGDYLIYRRWPQQRVSIDGRADMYGDALLQDYYHIKRLQPGWHAILDRYAVDWVMFDTGSALAQALLIDPAWRRLYADDVASVFVRQ